MRRPFAIVRRRLSPVSSASAVAWRFAEADMRMALDDTAPYYRDAPEAQVQHAASLSAVRAFMRDALPEAPDDDLRNIAADLVLMIFTGVGKRISEQTADQTESLADGLADMLCGYVERLRGSASAET